MLRWTGALARSTFCAVDETSQPIDVLVSVTRDGSGTFGAQIEDQLRRAIRRGGPQGRRPRPLDPGPRPSARRLPPRGGRRLLAAGRRGLPGPSPGRAPQGLRGRRAPRGRRIRAAALHRRFPDSTSVRVPPTSRASRAPPGFARCGRRSARSPTPISSTATRAGSQRLRSALAEYLGRVRGVVADPELVIVTSGYSQGAGHRLQGARRPGCKADRVRGPEPSRAASRRDRGRASRSCRSRSTRAACGSRSSSGPTSTRSSSPLPTSIRPARSSRASGVRRCSRGSAPTTWS